MNVLNARAVAARVGLSLRTFYAEVSAGRFPRPIQLTERRVGWLETDVDGWLSAKVAQREEGRA